MFRPLGKFDQDAGVTPLLFQKTMGFFVTTDCQDISLMSHLKAFLTVAIKSP